MQAVAHASRNDPPEYLLPPDRSLGTHCVIDDDGEVGRRLTEKMAMASHQARANKDYSPMWEGVINLPEPSQNVTVKDQISIVKRWCSEYEKITGHTVLRADVHLDEGFIDGAGKTCFNAHSHVMADRTDAKGRVIKLSPAQLRAVQTMTAEVTNLERGKDARQTRRKHVGHQNFKFIAEKNRLDQDLDFAAQIDKLKADYATDRAALKASGEATQAQYKALKAAHELALKDLEATKKEAVKVPVLEAKTVDLTAQIEALKAQYTADRAALKASGEAKQKDYVILKSEHEAAIEKLKFLTKKVETMEQEKITQANQVLADQAKKRLSHPRASAADLNEIEAALDSKANQKLAAELAATKKRLEDEQGYHTSTIKKAIVVQNQRNEVVKELEATKARFAQMATEYELHKAAGKNPSDFMPPVPPKKLILCTVEGEEVQTPPASWIRGYAPGPVQPGGFCAYRTTSGLTAFTDKSDGILFHLTDPATIGAGLQLAAQKWPNGYTLTGGVEFKHQALVLAVAMGHKVNNPDLQDVYAALKQAVEAAKPIAAPTPLPTIDEPRLGQQEAADDGYDGYDNEDSGPSGP